MIVDDLATYIANNTDLTVADDLFINNLPASPNNLVAIYDTGGAENSRYVPIEQPTFQIIVRNTSASEAHELADSIHDLLHQVTNETIGDYYFYFIYDMGRPSSIGHDKQDRFEYSINFNCRIRA